MTLQAFCRICPFLTKQWYLGGCPRIDTTCYDLWCHRRGLSWRCSNWSWLVKIRWYQLKVDLLFDPQLFLSNLSLLSGMQQQKHGETQQKVVKDIEAFTCSMQVFFFIFWLILAVCFWPSRLNLCTGFLYLLNTLAPQEMDNSVISTYLRGFFRLLWRNWKLQADWEAIEELRIGVGPIGTQNLGSWKIL